jgi:hypothetical protein
VSKIAETIGDQNVVDAPSQGDVDTLANMINGFMVTQVVRAAADLRLADHLAGGAKTAEEVAALESSDPATTYRLMRTCVSLGLLAHKGDGYFTTTPMGQLLRTGTGDSMRHMAMAYGSPGHWLSWGRAPDSVRGGQSQVQQALGMSLFEHFAANPAEGASFVSAMSALTRPVLSEAARVIDTTGVSRAVDVGGGDGSLLRSLMSANPELRGTVFDRPAVVEAALRDADRAGLSDRLSGQDGDFLESVPEGDLYLLKSILHDWPDSECVRILQNCRKAASPDARLMVVELVILDDWPLEATLMDLNMLALTNGQERDLAGYDALFAAAGWKRTALHRMNSAYSVIEARIAE